MRSPFNGAKVLEMSEMRETQQESAPKPSLVERVRLSPITFLIAAINLAVFVLAESQGDTTDPHTLLRFGAIEPLHVRLGEYWRLGTYMFLHIGWMHLIWNTWASVSWCTLVEGAVGSRRFLAIYLLAGVGGGAVSVIFSPAISAGASGAMFGIVGATLALRRRQLPDWAAFIADKGVRSTFGNIALWTVIGLTALRMNHYAHFGGMFIGALATQVLAARRWNTAALAGFAIGFAALLGVAIRPDR